MSPRRARWSPASPRSRGGQSRSPGTRSRGHWSATVNLKSDHKFAEPVAVSSTSKQCIRLPPSSSPESFGLVPFRARRDPHAAANRLERQPGIPAMCGTSLLGNGQRKRTARIRYSLKQSSEASSTRDGTGPSTRPRIRRHREGLPKPRRRATLLYILYRLTLLTRGRIPA